MNINHLCTHSNSQNESPDSQQPSPRRRGAPCGNKNACTHGFYSRHFVENARKELQQADKLSGLDRELYLAFWRVQLVLKNDPDNIAVQKKASAELIELVRLKYNIGVNDIEGITNALQKVSYDIAISPELIQRLGQDW